MGDSVSSNKIILHSAFHHDVLRKWQSLNSALIPENFMYPVFVTDEEYAEQEISAMPGISRYGTKTIVEHLTLIVESGLSSVLIFGVPNNVKKDAVGSSADSENSIVVKTIKLLKEAFSNLLVACDVCLCAYTDHGHCGLLNEDSSINNAASIKRIAEIALAYAKAGCDVVAPSDMMDGRVSAIKKLFRKSGYESKVAILSYSAKFSSCFYGPFREAANSAPSFGDRRCYQFPSGSSGLAMRAAARDVLEGADMLMVKPALSYLDIVRQIKDKYPEYPLAVYQVSGEYSMLLHAGKAGSFNVKSTIMEIFQSMRRAGADIIISYFTPQVLSWLNESASPR